MSAFDRLPEDYRALCDRLRWSWQEPSRRVVSPQNRRVRFAADLHLARQKAFLNTDTRQQRHAKERLWKRRAA